MVELLRKRKEGSEGERRERRKEEGRRKGELDLAMGESSGFKGSLRTTVYGSRLIGMGTNASLCPGGQILSISN